MTAQAKKIQTETIQIGQVLPDTIKYHIKKYVSPTDYGYVGYKHKVSAGTIDRVFRNTETGIIPVSEKTYPAVMELAEMALNRIEAEVDDAKISRKTLTKLLKN
jgi:hypothetical protein